MFTLWDAATGQVLDRKSERQSGLVLDLAFRPDGQALAIGLGDGTTDYVDVSSPDERSSAELTLWSQVITNTRLDDKGNFVPLSHDEWSAKRQALRAIQSLSAENP